MVFFVLPGLILLVVSAWTLGAVAIDVVRQFFLVGGSIDNRLYDAFASTWRARPQSFIVGGFSFVVAVQLISLGLLATQSQAVLRGAVPPGHVGAPAGGPHRDQPHRGRGRAG